MEELEHMKVFSTRDQIEDAKASMFWRDVVRELTAWKEGFNREMMSIVDDAEAENPSTASVLLHMGDLNGRQKAVDYILSLPDVFLSFLEEQRKEPKEVSDE